MFVATLLEAYSVSSKVSNEGERERDRQLIQISCNFSVAERISTSVTGYAKDK